MTPERIEKSRHILEKLFLPILLLRASKKRDERLTQKLSKRSSPPDENILRQTWLFSNWPTVALKNVFERSTLKAFSDGRVVGLEGEPRKHLSVFYVVSGRVSHIPTKKEMRALALYVPEVNESKYHKADPLRWFRFRDFEQDETAGASVSISRDLLLGNLHIYRPGQLVDVELLLLGAPGRPRSLRCRSESVLLDIPLDAILTQFASLKPHTRQVALDKARSTGCSNLAKGNEKPSFKDIMYYNPVLQGLSTGNVEGAWMKLRPYLFCKGEIICTDVYNSNMVYFLKSGQVSITSSNSKETKVIDQCASHVGLDSFMVHTVPSCIGDHHMAVARCFCILWGINISDLNDLCCPSGLLNCALLASKMVKHKWSRLDITGCLRKLVAFAPLSNDCLDGIAKDLEARVYPPGRRVVSGGVLKGGIIVLVGKCAFGKISENARHVSCGEPLYFCESLLNMTAPKLILAETSVMVLHCPPKVILDAVQAFDNASDITNVLKLANEYVVGKYNLDISKTGIARQRAAQRVWETKKKEHMLAAINRKDHMAKIQSKEDDNFLGAAIIENNILTNLTLQLQSLHYNEEEAQRYHFLHEAPVFHSTQHVVQPTSTYRNDDYFTIDNSGKIVFCEKKKKSKTTLHLEPINGINVNPINKCKKVLNDETVKLPHVNKTIDNTFPIELERRPVRTSVIRTINSPVPFLSKSLIDADAQPLKESLQVESPRKTTTQLKSENGDLNMKIETSWLIN
ncbi:unnamed protein product [Phytomonas sp. EM1]|nr:unnamed protein product [Phytomonas sp. EM1]|eukprot:CCW64035.1 unnamed protein product [Phytomonas sp. isolate EM1]